MIKSNSNIATIGLAEKQCRKPKTLFKKSYSSFINNKICAFNAKPALDVIKELVFFFFFSLLGLNILYMVKFF